MIAFLVAVFVVQASAQTITAAAPAIVLSGHLEMDVQSSKRAIDFVVDTEAKNAVNEGLANLLGLQSSSITLTVTRHTDYTSSRSMNVAYTITLPASSNVTASSVKSIMSSATAAEVTTQVATAVTAAKGATYIITVYSKSPITDGPPADGSVGSAFKPVASSAVVGVVLAVAAISHPGWLTENA